MSRPVEAAPALVYKDGEDVIFDGSPFSPELGVDVATVVTNFDAPDDVTIPSSAAVQTALDLKWDVPTAETFVADPTGSVTDQDDEARAAIVSIRDALVTLGLMEAGT